MNYVRTFRLQAAHFNSEEAYRIAWRVIDGKPFHDTTNEIELALRECHGHNFKIEVRLTGLLDGPWLVDDEKLADIVMAWDNINLSMHPDFTAGRERATTENMAATLLVKLRAAFNSTKLNVSSVKVEETEDIYAVAK